MKLEKFVIIMKIYLMEQEKERLVKELDDVY